MIAGNRGQFGNPFIDAASTFMPASVTGMYRHAEFLTVCLDPVRAAFNKMAAYFLGDVKISGEMGDDERDRQKKFYVDDFGIWPAALTAGLSTLIYGNAFLSVLAPIKRFLGCPKCGGWWGVERMARRPGDVVFMDGKFQASCPACPYSGAFEHDDQVDKQSTPVWRVWNPHDIDVVDFNGWYGQAAAYEWVVPPDVRADVKGGQPAILSTAPIGVIEAAATTGRFRFNPDQIYHWCDVPIPGLRTRGVGIPRTITSYRRMLLLQLLYRQYEVLTTSFVSPFRVVSPAPAVAGDRELGDIIRSSVLSNSGSMFFNMLDVHRKDPAAWHYSPTALQYQAFGADANQLVPVDIMQEIKQTALTGIGAPVELWQGTLAAEQVPFGIRMYERGEAPFVHGLNGALAFMSQRVCRIRAYQPGRLELVPPRLADDMESKQILFQLAASGRGPWDDFTRASGLGPYKDMVAKRFEEQRTELVEQEKFQRDQQTMAIGAQASTPPAPGQAPPGGQAQGGGQAAAGQPQQAPLPDIPSKNAPIAADELDERAQAEASSLVNADDGQRAQRLLQLRNANDTYHRLVLQHLQQLRSQQRSQGQRMIQAAQQQQQQGGPAAAA